MAPSNLVFYTWALLFTASLLVRLGIAGLAAGRLSRATGSVPEAFAGAVAPDDLEKSRRYALANLKFGMAETLFDKGVEAFLLTCGVLPWLAGLVSGLSPVPAGLVFFAAPTLLGMLLSLPFDHYRDFVIEKRFGFSTTTLGTWITDQAKNLVLTAILGGLLLSAILGVIGVFERFWWLAAWLVFMGFQTVMTALYPTVIAPMFNTFTPLPDGGLKDAIESLTEKLGVSVSGIYTMDASRRTRHTNAYFAGLSRTKRIVLYDSLIRSHAQDEILAVLAHEIGHMKHRDVLKQVLLLGAFSFALFYVAARLATWPPVFTAFGFSTAPVYAGLFLAAAILTPLLFFLYPVGMALSRRFERRADRFAATALGSGRPLIEAFRRMARDNLADLDPHPLRVFFLYSHPPLVERVAALEAFKPEASA